MKLTFSRVAVTQQHVKGVLGHPDVLSVTENIIYYCILTFRSYKAVRVTHTKKADIQYVYSLSKRLSLLLVISELYSITKFRIWRNMKCLF